MKIIETKTGQRLVCLPIAICRMKNWKGGTNLGIVTNEKGDLILKEIRE